MATITWRRAIPCSVMTTRTTMAILHVVVAVHNAYKIVEGNRNDAKVVRNIYLGVDLGSPTAFVVRFDSIFSHYLAFVVCVAAATFHLHVCTVLASA